MIELAIPLLSAATTGLGSAMLGYRLQRRAKKIRAAIVQRINDGKRARAIDAKVDAVLAKVEPLYHQIVKDLDSAKVSELVDLLKAKHGLVKVSDPLAPVV